MLKGHKPDCKCASCSSSRGERIIHSPDCKCCICSIKHHGNWGKNNPFYGQKHTQETLGHLSKVHPDVSRENGYFYGKHHSQESKDRISRAKIGIPSSHREDCCCPWCSSLKGEKSPRYGKHHTLETKKKISIAQTGDKVFNGFIGKRGYGKDFTDELCEQIRERDNYVCQSCKTEQSRRKYDVHHIDYNKKNNHPQNLILLCMVCHRRTGHNREIWRKFFEEYQNCRFENQDIIGGNDENNN